MSCCIAIYYLDYARRDRMERTVIYGLVMARLAIYEVLVTGGAPIRTQATYRRAIQTWTTPYDGDDADDRARRPFARCTVCFTCP